MCGRVWSGHCLPPDAQNPLAVAGPATLLTHVGGGYQLKSNKAAVSQVFSLKVSVDDITWTGPIPPAVMSGTAAGFC